MPVAKQQDRRGGRVQGRREQRCDCRRRFAALFSLSFTSIRSRSRGLQVLIEDKAIKRRGSEQRKRLLQVSNKSPADLPPNCSREDSCPAAILLPKDSHSLAHYVSQAFVHPLSLSLSRLVCFTRDRRTDTEHLLTQVLKTAGDLIDHTCVVQPPPSAS